jgi:arsenate reductase
MAAGNSARQAAHAHGIVMHGIPNCDTVKKARVWLESHGVEFAFHDYKKAGIDAATLRAWLEQVPLETLLNRRGTTWRALSDELKAAAAEPDGAIALMIDKPSVIKRPVLVVDGAIKAVGFVADEYATLF